MAVLYLPNISGIHNDDIINLPALLLVNFDWQLSFDADKDMATKTHKAIVAEAVADNFDVAG